MNNGNGNTIIGAPPRHVAIIMDGSGRWAVARGLPRVEGHRAGRAAVCRTVEAAGVNGLSILTLFTFSTDNWGRPQEEVTELMRTFESFLRQDAPAFARRGVRWSVIGRRDRLPYSVCESIDRIEADSSVAGRLHVRLAIDYSGREAILRAARQFQRAADAPEESFARLVTQVDGRNAALEVDLLIRTGGELRLSNCPLWEIAYAELYFTSCLWPDFDAAELSAALSEFSKRHRRYGRIPAPVAVSA